MRILDVIPIGKSIGVETLSYFSGKDVPLGSLVTVPMRKKGVTGIVIASHDIATIKSAVKTADFQLRNIINVHKGTLFLPEFIQSCVYLKNYYTNTTGSIISALVPKLFLDEYLESVSTRAIPEPHKQTLMPEKFIFQATWESRISYYKTYIRQEFANKRSVFIMAPTIADIDRLSKELGKGISERVIPMHSSFAKKKLRENYEHIMKSVAPVVIIGTASYLFIPRIDIKTLIVEKEGSPYYRQMNRPFIDYREVAYTLAHVRGLKYIVADRLLRFQTLHTAKENHFGEIEPLSFHLKSRQAAEIISMKSDSENTLSRTKSTTGQAKTDFAILDASVRKLLEEGVTKKKHILLFVGRKGLAPITACDHCGAVVKSPDSGAPLVLYQKKDASGKKKPVYQCPVTQKTYDTIDTCQNCDSWKLKLLGIGAETIEKEIENAFPKLPITIVDGNHTKTHAATKKAVASFWKKKSGVMIATEKIIPYVEEPFDTVIIVSVDTLFAVPGYAIQERIMRLLLAFQDASKERFIIQTRATHSPVLRELQKGNLSDFYRSELRDRKAFLYPPYSLLLDVSVGATAKTLTKKKKQFEILFKKHKPNIVVHPGKKRGLMVVHAFMKIPLHEWIKTTSSKNPGQTFRELFPVLENLPQSYMVQIDPEKI